MLPSMLIDVVVRARGTLRLTDGLPRATVAVLTTL
jgi:hypothetical protein